MRILLTGSGGFLGGHLLRSDAGQDMKFIRALREDGADADDTVRMGPAPWGKKQFAHALDVSRADVVIHCAGATRAETSQGFFEANLFPTLGLLEAMADRPVSPRVMLIGSAAEYGIVPPARQPVTEDHPCNPQTMYGIAKHAQTMAALAAAERGLPILVARLFNPLGPGMPSHLAVPSFARRIVAAMEGDKVLRVGDLSVERDFIDVNEAARILLELVRMPDWPWPLVNLCSGFSYKLSDMLSTMMQCSGIPFRITVDPALLRRGDMPLLVGSTDRLTSVELRPAQPQIQSITSGILAEAFAAHRRANDI